VHDLTFFDVKFHVPFIRPFTQVVQGLLEPLSVLVCAHGLAQLGIVRELAQDVDESGGPVQVVDEDQKEDWSQYAPLLLAPLLRSFWLVLTIQTVMPVGFTILLLYAENKQKNQCNGVSRLRKNVSEKLSIVDPLLKEEKPLQFEFTNIAAKKPQPLL
jgi:hypothetical protein